ncbi:NYN domain-containing protein [Ilumatobacter nonamiensis]|uniref:NYN domain-containing protein n=1 Tax=Ilumatobacter nonamiensis TaxID=467093 RepID=UPI000345F2E6|nr:NYN domain-containing protein [Ilumatobacter nonamiensis]
MATIEHRDLRSALEFAVLIAAESQKRRASLAFPKELKPFLSKSRLATSSLGRIRRAIEADPDFRSTISTVADADPDLIDEVGRLWLAGRDGWEGRAAQVIAERDDQEQTADLRRDLKRSEKRRVAAEQAAARVQVDVMQRDETIAEQAAQLDELRADLTKAAEALDEVRSELIDTRNEARHARDREAAAVERAEIMAQQPPPVPSATEPDPDESSSAEALIRAERQLAAVLDASREFAERVELLVATRPERADTRSPRRPTLPVPGGLIATSAAAAQHLVTQHAPVLVDGYNVAKLAWPDRSLEQQRDMLVSRCENLARRHDATVTVVFDGDSVPGAHAKKRRSIRVVYSPAGTTADDVIRSEVDHLPADTAVIVVTNDREIVDDVKAVGANVIPSNAFLAIL